MPKMTLFRSIGSQVLEIGLSFMRPTDEQLERLIKILTHPDLPALEQVHVTGMAFLGNILTLYFALEEGSDPLKTMTWARKGMGLIPSELAQVDDASQVWIRFKHKNFRRILWAAQRANAAGHHVKVTHSHVEIRQRLRADRAVSFEEFVKSVQGFFIGDLDGPAEDPCEPEVLG